MRNFTGTPTFVFDAATQAGAPQGLPASVCKPSKYPPTVVPVVIDWASYGASFARPNVGVILDTILAGSRQQLDQIASVVIDNTGVPVPVYVQFLDTLDIAICPPFSKVVQQVQTNQLNANIYGLGFTDLTPGRTKIQFCNVVLPPIVEPEIQTVFPQWISSPNIARSNALTSGFYAPALGDQTVQTRLSAAAAGSSTILNSVTGGGFYIVTSVVVQLFNPIGFAGFQQEMDFGIFSTSGDALYRWHAGARATGDAFVSGVVPIYSVGGLQLKLSADVGWQLSNFNNIGAGTIDCYLTYTFTTQGK